MFFEGSEKKAEVIVNQSRCSLLKDFSDEFWHQLVEQCHAKILSSIRSSQVKAFLLSESSLFIWNDRLLILTCGDTRLVNSIEYLLKEIDQDIVEQVIYQRKNEYCSHLQASHVLDDARQLHRLINGKFLRLGDLDSHHSYLYHLDNCFKSDIEDKTYEVLIYNISQTVSQQLTRQDIDKQQIRELLQLDKLITGFEVDDFLFEPWGYSLNAIRGPDYFTIHLTPQQHNSYVSFESNLDLFSSLPVILEVFKPQSFDLLSYNEESFSQKIEKVIPDDYKAKELVQEKLSCSYLVSFATYIRERKQFTQPTTISLEGENNVF